MPADLSEMKNTLRDLFNSQALCVLGTQRDGQPYTSLVAFASSPDLRSLLFATSRSTRKFANLESDPRVSILVDNRTNSTADFRLAKAVTATGKVEYVEKEREFELRRIYLEKHPYLNNFLDSPSCELIKINVRKYYLVSRFQNVTEIHVTL